MIPYRSVLGCALDNRVMIFSEELEIEDEPEPGPNESTEDWMDRIINSYWAGVVDH